MNFVEEAFSECEAIIEKRIGKLSPQAQEDELDLLKYLDLLSEKTKENKIFGDESTKIGEYVVVEGPVFVGKNVNIAHYAYLRGPIIIGDNCVVTGEIKKSIILSATKSTHRNNYVGDSVIGRNCNLGCGTKFANLRFEKDEIILRKGEEKIPTGKHKFGSIVEDNCKFGINSSIGPGSYIKEGTHWVGSKAHNKK
jgi:NDP-sugar pyrophosphorylase family protein